MKVRFENLQDTTISVYLMIRRVKFFVDKTWINSLRRMYYGSEMKAKYISELHQNHAFEREHLQDIIDFPGWMKRSLHITEKAILDLEDFGKEYSSFNAIIAADGMRIENPNHPVITNGNILAGELEGIVRQLKLSREILSTQGYRVLEHVEALSPVNFNAVQPLPDHINYRDIFDSGPVSEHFMLNDFVNAYNRTQTSLNAINRWTSDFVKNRNHKIIAGIAGTGKTHTIGYLIQEIDKNGDYTIFLNARSFDGDETQFSRRFHSRLFIPDGYNLLDTLRRLNNFAKKKRRRLFIIFDALNETTTSSFGFSPIWGRELQNFIDLLSGFPYLYLICTLRTSYIEEIWSVPPEKVATLNGIDRSEDTLQMCKRYFDYYKIEATNLETADVNIFKIPLLLDLFCKMTNVHRNKQKTITLDGRTYQQIFEGYIEQMVKDVVKRRNLVAKSPVYEGLHNCSAGFMQNIEATLPLKDFISSFDPIGHLVDKDKSIAQPMLEGNLVFIKERSGPRLEIVKHTQQLIGGYLLALYLTEVYPEEAQLLASPEFLEKIVGNDPALRHQLRLDVIKFLIIFRPMLISAVTDRSAFQEGWWYLYNGFDGTHPEFPQQLLANPLSLEIFPYVSTMSMSRWIDPVHDHNFKFISTYLQQFGMWEFDINWTLYLYNNYELFFDFINERINKLKAGDAKADNEPIAALLIAFVQATTVRELRDRATAYLIEFGKVSPMDLLEIVKQCAEVNDTYIYQRMVHALYGVVLIKQHDQQFLEDHLPIIADTLFRLQFAKNATHAVYDYIVIDSIKHLLDLALYKGVWKEGADDIRNVNSYFVPNLSEWAAPSAELIEEVIRRPEMSPPEPIGMDFAIYTIPRLLDNHQYGLRSIAVSNVLNRLYNLGFKREDNVQLENYALKSFYYGDSVSHEGKVDKLGKKYNWKGFFDYAGYLLQLGELNIYRIFGDPTSGYQRLSDVEIDISMPNRNFEISEQFYFDELIPAGDRIENWQMENKIETIEPHLIREFNGVNYVMLKGFVEQRIDDGYGVRSFIMVESCFINKGEGFEVLRDEICSEVFNWDRDLHLSPSYDSGVYFGEYYWADNQISEDKEHFSVKTGKQVVRRRMVGPNDLFGGEFDFKMKDVNKEHNFTYDEMLGFDGEATLIQYLNESNSESFKGFSMYIPTAKMGKYLGLKADPATGMILDANLQPCLITVDYNIDLIKNEATFIRADLLKKYTDDHGYAVMYQNKQHSYDEDAPQNRIMKYVVVEL